MNTTAKGLFAGCLFTLSALTLSPTANADYVTCHVSPGGALWCEDYETGQSWQASSYGTYDYTPAYCNQPYISSQLC